MQVSWQVDRVRVLRSAATAVASLIGATVLVGLLELGVGPENASNVYLLAVAAVAIRWGTVAALGTAFGGFLAYNFLFIDPRYSFGRPAPGAAEPAAAPCRGDPYREARRSGARTRTSGSAE